MSNIPEPAPQPGPEGGFEAPTPPPSFRPPAAARPEPGRPANGFRFGKTAGGRRGVNDVMPTGITGMFRASALPTELRISYYIWLLGGLLSVVVSVLFLIATLLVSTAVAEAGQGAALALAFGSLAASLVLAAAQILFALRMKEGYEWARIALTVVAALSLVAAVVFQNWLSFLVSAVATVLMWLPNAQAWFRRPSA